MNNIISVSGGNDSTAMLLVIDRIRKQDPVFFKDDTWNVCYFNTGWARDGWGERTDLIKKMCNAIDIAYHKFQTRKSAIDRAMAKVAGVEYEDWNFFGMFNYKNCGNQKGIIKQNLWAKKRVKYLDSLPKQ